MLGKILGGRYKIVSRLGEGGFGETYLAEDIQLPDRMTCVVKHFKPQSSNPDVLSIARRLFESEAKVLHQLGSHDQIPRLLAHFEENQEFYLVQEFIAGNTLSHELTPGVSIEEAKVIEILQDLLKTLEFVHQQQVIHRDLKPDNLIRRTQDRKIVLIDFGAVKQIRTQVISQGQMPSTVTIGTVGYMPSEQANGHPMPSSDLYALGMIGIQALTGLAPNQILKDPQTLEVIWHDQAEVGTQVSIGFANALDRMVRYDFRQRYQSATEAMAALVGLRSNIPTIAIAGLRANVSPQRVETTVQAVSGQWRISPKLLAGIGIGGGAIAAFWLSPLSSWLRVPQINPPLETSVASPSQLNPNSTSTQPQVTQPLPTATDFYDQAKTLSNAGEYQASIETYDKAIELKPDYAEAWAGKGDALFKLGRYQSAIAAYDKAIFYKPDFADAKRDRAIALAALEPKPAPATTTNLDSPPVSPPPLPSNVRLPDPAIVRPLPPIPVEVQPVPIEVPQNNLNGKKPSKDAKPDKGHGKKK